MNSGFVDLINELMEINEETKGNDYTVDALRYVLVNRKNVIREIKVFSTRYLNSINVSVRIVKVGEDFSEAPLVLDDYGIL